MSTLPFYYEVVGSGTPLIFIHAGVCDCRMWDEQFQAFADAGYRVARYDLRGWGNSPLPDGEFAHHEDIIALCDAVGFDKAWLVGASHGGKVAIDTALTFPERVRGLLLVNAAAGGWEGGPSLDAFGEAEDALLEKGELEAATELNLKMWVDGPYRTPEQSPAEVRARVGAMQLHAFQLPTPPNVALKKVEPPALHRLHEIKVPTLVLVGALDVPEFVTLAEQLGAGIPGARLEVIDGVAHLPSMEMPDLFNAKVLEFLNAESQR